MTKHVTLWLTAILSMFFFGACVAMDDEPYGLTDDDNVGVIQCTGDEECPDDYYCSKVTYTCVPVGGSDAETTNDTAGGDSMAEVDTVDDVDAVDSMAEGDSVTPEQDTVIPDTDSTPTNYPVVVSSSPAKNETDAAIAGPLVITFSMAMQLDSLRVNSNIILAEQTAADTWEDLDMDADNATYDNVAFTLTIPFNAPLKKATTYRLRMLNSVLGSNGTTLNNGTMQAPKPEIITFETLMPPYISTSVPVDGGANVALDTDQLMVYFNETVVQDNLAAVLSPGNVTLPLVPPSGASISATFTIPASTLAAGTDYSILVVGAEDLKGNVMADATLTFTSAYAVAPTIVEFFPTGVDQPMIAEARVVFDQKMDPTTITASKITVKKVVGSTRVALTPAPTVTYDAAARTALIAADYDYETTYEISVAAGGTTGVKNASGIVLADDGTDGFILSQFTTKENVVVLASDFSTDDGLWAVTDSGVNLGWILNTTDGRYEITLSGSDYYLDDVDSWLHTVNGLDLTDLPQGASALMEFAVMSSTYASTIDTTNNDGVEILLWDTATATMADATPVPTNDISADTTTYLGEFLDGKHQGITGYDDTQTYITYTVDLGGYAGKTVGIAFRFLCDDSWDKKYGARIDSVDVSK